MMPNEHEGAHVFDRRRLLRGATGVGLSAAAAALLAGCGSGAESGSGSDAAAEGPPETTTIRWNRNPLSCSAAQAVASEFLQQEGFTDVQHLDIDLKDQFSQLAAGALDMHMYPAQLTTARVDAGDPVVILGGAHVGCWQLVGTDAVTSIRDFKGKTIATAGAATPDEVLLAATLANVGLDVRKDVRVVTLSPAEVVRVLTAGDVDGLLTLPPFSQQLRASGVGHVVVDSMVDRPWSQYFCCMATVNRDFMADDPVATKRAFRTLKGADVVSEDPKRGVRAMVDLGYKNEKMYDATVEDLRMIPFDTWRQYDRPTRCASSHFASGKRAWSTAPSSRSSAVARTSATCGS